jgi:hypothetical protein
LRTVRWLLFPLVYVLASAIGIWLWLELGSLSIAMCPPEKIWFGGASGNMKCHWPLPVFFVKDIIGASIVATLIVFACAVTAPSHKRLITFSIAAISSAFGAWLLYWPEFNSPRLLSHRITVFAVFSVVLFLMSALILRRIDNSNDKSGA